ncbi:MAG TPA: M64 family metallopeptidase, partial [Burkholderiaceae bacterium]|nr:M64 family metallopeptidase [Burkholderiaceae bacterium]
MIRSIAGAALLAAAVAAQAPIVNTVVNNGSTASHYDLVFLGDGYQAAQRTQFDQDVLTCVTSMFQHVPYSTFASYFNVHTVFRASVDAGASQPDVQPPIVRNTA